jgi:hypothetical protein
MGFDANDVAVEATGSNAFDLGCRIPAASAGRRQERAAAAVVAGFLGISA